MLNHINRVFQVSLIRKHWKIENNLLRQLDITFEEDKSVTHTGFAEENLATFDD